MTINDTISTCELVFFSHFRINVTKRQVHDNADFSITVELTLAHFTTLKSFARLVWGVIEPPSVVFSVCHTFTRSWCAVGMFMTDAQIANS